MLIGYWPLNGVHTEQTGAFQTESYRVKYVDGVDGRPHGAAWFNGIDSYLRVSDAPDLAFGTRPFTVAAWVKPAPFAAAEGDLFSKFDSDSRKGWHWTIGGFGSGYSSIGDCRYSRFAIDNGSEVTWTDSGKPRDDNTLITAMVTYQGKLYAGIADALTDEDACHVYRYEGDGEWTDVGRIGTDVKTRSVQSMIVHQGSLYAGSGTWNWPIPNARLGGPNRVFRYCGGTEWEDIGGFGIAQRVLCLASWQGDLYAGDDEGQCYRYDGGQRWTYCGQLGQENRLNSMTVWRDRLYGASHGNIYLYEGGETWSLIGDHPFGITQIHKLNVYNGDLIVGTWHRGYVLKYLGAGEWESVGTVGIDPEEKINEINDLIVFNGKCYAGVIPKAELYRFERPGHWTNFGRLVNNPEWAVQDPVSWTRIPCFGIWNGNLYAGTSTCYGKALENPDPDVGKVFRIEAGKAVTYDHDLGTAWTFLAAVRTERSLQLYVNGELAAETPVTDGPSFDLTNGQPLLIGTGAHHFFKGTVADLRLYGTDLTVEQLADIQRHPYEV